MKSSMKIVFFIHSMIYFFIIKKIWYFIFNDLIPNFGNTTDVVYLMGLVVMVFPISLIITKYIFDFIREN